MSGYFIYSCMKYLIKLLVNSGADVNIKDGDDDSPLYLSTLNGDMEICKLLIDFGADMNAKNGIYKNHGNFDFLTGVEEEEIIKSYPEKYKEYLIMRDAEKYNL